MNILHVKSIEVTYILCVRRSFWRFLPFLLVLPSLLFCYKTKMTNNSTTAPIFFSSFLSLWPKYPLPPVTIIFFLGTYQHPFTDLLPKDFRSRFDKRACIQPAATYLGHELQNQQCGVIVISYNLIGGSSSFQCCHMIVNGPIEIIYQTESDGRMRKWT